jgi:type IV fimbrial biogenesis protein FimT
MRGFSLIELIVGMAILGILMSIGIPAFSDWMRNARVRTTAESVLNGLQLARAEAVRRNTTVGLYLVDTTTSACALSTAGPNWIVSVDSPVGQCDVAPSDDPGNHASFSCAAEPKAAARRQRWRRGKRRSFSMALVAPRPCLAAPSLSVSPTQRVPPAWMLAEPVRCLRAEISVGGQIRMCDPALPTTDAQGCG